MTAEPILCFDGDSAGKRAAFRAVDTALPHLKPGASLMFAFLPDGLDPDDLVRQQGPAALDACLGRVGDAVLRAGGAMIVTADHGNAEMMRDPATGQAHTAHTLNLVPIMLIGGPMGTLRDGRLADVAPTALHLLGLPQPESMTGHSLLTETPAPAEAPDRRVPA